VHNDARREGLALPLLDHDEGRRAAAVVESIDNSDENEVSLIEVRLKGWRRGAGGTSERWHARRAEGQRKSGKCTPWWFGSRVPSHWLNHFPQTCRSAFAPV
jgi:hypothetical protein